MRRRDYVGRVYGAWTVRGFSHKQGSQVYWLAQCECGTLRPVAASNLRSGASGSCGCRGSAAIADARRVHGQWGTPTYGSWAAMNRRCRAEPRYLARGITVCSRWSVFANFLADMGERPDGKSLDRIDNEKGYSPENCRWATARQQNRNTTRNRRVTFEGRTLCVTEWAAELGMPPKTLALRFARGWSPERALTTPVGYRTVWLECGGETRNLTGWANHLGVSASNLWNKLYCRKIPLEDLVRSARGCSA